VGVSGIHPAVAGVPGGGGMLIHWSAVIISDPNKAERRDRSGVRQ
jgi:hypothetical protein